MKKDSGIAFNSSFAVNLRSWIEREQRDRKALGTKGNVKNELAKHCGVTLMTVSNWYNGVNEPKPETRKKVAEFFHEAESTLYEEQRKKSALPDTERMVNDSAAWCSLEESCTTEEAREFVENWRCRMPDFFSRTIAFVSLAYALNNSQEASVLPITEHYKFPPETVANMIISAYCRELERALCKLSAPNYAIGWSDTIGGDER